MRTSTLIVFLLLATIFSSCLFNTNEDRIWSHAQENVGHYQLNLRKSDLGIYSAGDSIYRTLTLKINPDTTFEFSFDTPFITQVKGKWTMRGDDMSQRCVFPYDDISNDHVLLDLDGGVYIKY